MLLFLLHRLQQVEVLRFLKPLCSMTPIMLLTVLALHIVEVLLPRTLMCLTIVAGTAPRLIELLRLEI